MIPLKLLVAEDGLTVETGLKLKQNLIWTWHIIYPTSQSC